VEDLFPLFEGRDHTAYFVEADGHPDARAFALIAPVVAEAVRHSPTG
jgi:hypothetical protein